MKSALVLAFSLVLFAGSNYCQVLDDYRSNAVTSNWTTIANWQRFDGTTWIAASAFPTAANAQTITIQSGHNFTISAALTIDQTTVNAGGTITWTGGILTIANGTGTDFIVNGTFIDNSTANATFTGAPTGAKWQLGANATLIKNRANSAAVWRDNYEGGMATIPATSNWIIRKTVAASPTFTTVQGTYYGNFIIENTTGTAWAMPIASQFTGNSDFPTIKGNFDIGGTASTASITFTNTNTFTTPALVMGNMIVRAGNTYNNYGVGTEIQGNLTNAGTIAYDMADGRNLIFSGTTAQSITNTGTLGIYNFTINKSANTLTLNSPITVNNIATFTSGIVNSSLTNLFILNSAATVASTSNASFVNGPVRRLGGFGITFPVGKGSSYRPIGIGNGTVLGGVFWSETFGTATCAARGTLGNGFNSGNGAWTQTNGANGALANEWYVSPTEANMGSGICGDGCVGNATLTNSTLHVSAIGGLCGTPDCGSAYDATDADNITDKRIESPVINCTGQTGITLSFLYIGNGQGTLDNCLVWYFDGLTWSILTDPGASGLCGGLCPFLCQGTWTPFSIALPASANNNPNIRIGFQWVNNGDGAGADPSFGVDDITLSTTNNSVFTAEYFPTNPQVPYGNLLVPTLTSLSNCEYWILTRDAGTDARTVTLSWNATSCNAASFATFQVARHDGISTWQDHNGTPVGTAAGGTITTPLPVANFSPFALADSSGPLPVELLQFDGTCENGKVKLTWQTATELNNDYFTIEKSSDMINWTLLRSVDGAGNSNVSLSYEIWDHEAYPNNYYRLGQTDHNGQNQIFSPVFVKCTGTNTGINVYPNPSTGIINISIPDGSVISSLQVFNSLGQLAISFTNVEIKNTGIQSYDLSQLENGTYYLRVILDGELITQPINIIK